MSPGPGIRLKSPVSVICRPHVFQRSGTMKLSVTVFLLGAMCAAPVLGQGPGQGQAPPPPATDTVAPDIPGVVKGGTKVTVIKDDFQGTEGPIALPDGTLAFTEGGANRITRIDRDGKVSVLSLIHISE